MKYGIQLFLLLMIAGCASPLPDFPQPDPAISENFTTAPQDGATSFEYAGHYLTPVGTLLIMGGMVFAALTRLSTGFGVSLILAGVGMLVLSWTFAQWWVPWLSLLSVAGYGGYWVTRTIKRLHKATTFETLFEG